MPNAACWLAMLYEPQTKSIQSLSFFPLLRSMLLLHGQRVLPRDLRPLPRAAGESLVVLRHSKRLRCSSRLVVLAAISGQRTRSLAEIAKISEQRRAEIKRNDDDTHQQTGAVYTLFTWPRALKGENISLHGSFNEWAKGYKLHRFGPENDASVVLPLRPGNYEVRTAMRHARENPPCEPALPLLKQFKFVVDDVWMTAPFEPVAVNYQGHLNNHRVVAPTMRFSLRAPDARQVLVVGDWDDWRVREAGRGAGR